ncbi:hypothetical protein Tco_0276623 [Tanacetum coccineum]
MNHRSATQMRSSEVLINGSLQSQHRLNNDQLKKEESPCLTAKASQIHEQDSPRAESSPSVGLTTAPKMVINSPCLNDKKELAITEQTATVSDHYSLKRALKHKLNLRSCTKVSTPQDGHLQGSSSETKESRGQEALN